MFVHFVFSLNKMKTKRHWRIPYHLFVNNPSTPTGPLAWSRLVLIPTWSTIKPKTVEKIWITVLLIITISLWKVHHLCTKAKASSITKPCTCVVEYSSTVWESSKNVYSSDINIKSRLNLFIFMHRNTMKQECYLLLKEVCPNEIW